jgi:hypothetical protein
MINLELENISPNYPNIISTSFNSNEHNEFIRFRTNYRPIGCKEELNICLTDHVNLPKVFLKFIVKLKHESNTSIEPLIMIFTIDVTEKMLSASESSEQGSANLLLKPLQFWNNIEPHEIEDYPGYKYDLNAITLPTSVSNRKWFKKKNYIYNNESDLEIVGNLDIPSNSIIPANSFIKAGGKISFGNNVTVGNNSHFKSGLEIDLGLNNFDPTIDFEVIPAPFLIFSCQDYNYANNKMTDEEIETVCNKSSYKQKALPNEPIKLPLEYDSTLKKKPITTKFNLNPNDCSLFKLILLFVMINSQTEYKSQLITLELLNNS